MTSISDVLKKLSNTGKDIPDIHKTQEYPILKGPASSDSLDKSKISEIRTEQDNNLSTTVEDIKSKIRTDGVSEIHSEPDKNTLWSEIIERLKSKDPLLACKLAETKIIDITNTALIIGFNGGMSVLADSVKKSSSLVEAMIKDITGNKLRLKIIFLPGMNQHGSYPVEDSTLSVFSDPVVKNVIELFNGKILEVKSLENKD
jgi:hypothetical protein